MKSTSLLISYIGISVMYLIILSVGHDDIAWFIKPLLLPFLIVAVYFAPSFSTKKFLITALLFSWIGDIILLFGDRAEIYFIGGLISFLISHVIYIVLFSKQMKKSRESSKALFWVGVTTIIMYLMMMLFLLLPTLGDLKLPVFVYALVLSTMLLFAFKGFFLWDKPERWYILIGAIVFVSSDSILAFNKFHHALQMSAVLIMSTYLFAQYMIVKGILLLNKKS
ncbi:MAG: putative membrane protein YhhN [Flavobacteriales bacterium]|jgi:uncharacterized membrane protein YhhN